MPRQLSTTQDSADFLFRRLRLRHLQLLTLLDETGSVRAAADQLNLSQPAVSKLVRNLEDELGLLLVDRAKEAKDLLSSWGLSERRDPRFYKLMADAQTRLGDDSSAHGSLAEYYYSVGEVPYAAEQLRIARDSPGLSNYQRQKIVARLEEVEGTLQRMMDERRR